MLVRTLFKYRNNFQFQIRQLNLTDQTQEFLKGRDYSEIFKICKRTRKEYQIVTLQPKYFEGTWDLLKDVFFEQETTSKFLEFHKKPRAKEELRRFFSWVADDGISFAAIDRQSGKVVSVNLNKLWFPEDSKFLIDYKKGCSFVESQMYMQELIDVDVFDLCPAKCILEVFVGASYPEVRGVGLAMEMFHLSVHLANYLRAKGMEEKHIPETIVCIVSSEVSKHMCSKAGLTNMINLKRPLTYGDKSSELDFRVMYANMG